MIRLSLIPCDGSDGTKINNRTDVKMYHLLLQDPIYTNYVRMSYRRKKNKHIIYLDPFTLFFLAEHGLRDMTYMSVYQW